MTKKKTSKLLKCDLHGKGNHDTSECYILKKLTKLGWSKTRGFNNINNEDESFEENIRPNYIYSVKSNFLDNPFFVEIEIFGFKRKCLLDTGADVSIIQENLIPPYVEQECYLGSIVSAEEHE